MMHPADNDDVVRTARQHGRRRHTLWWRQCGDVVQYWGHRHTLWRRRRCHDDIVSRLVQRRHCWHGDRSRHSDAVIHTVLATVLVWTMMPSSAKWRLPAQTSGCSHCVTAFCRMPMKTLVTPQILIDIHPEVRILTRPHTLGWSTWQWKKNFTESLALFLISFLLCYFITVQNIFQVGRDLDVAQSISNY